jgi:hypothetical protein
LTLKHQYSLESTIEDGDWGGPKSVSWGGMVFTDHHPWRRWELASIWGEDLGCMILVDGRLASIWGGDNREVRRTAILGDLGNEGCSGWRRWKAPRSGEGRGWWGRAVMAGAWSSRGQCGRQCGGGNGEACEHPQ